MSLETRLRHFPMRDATFIAARTALLAITQGRVLEFCIEPDRNLPYYSPWVTELAQVSLDGAAPARERVITHRAMPLERISLGAEDAILPFSDSDFDWVVSTLTLCRLHDPSRVLREVRRVLKPAGGYLFLEHGLSPEPRVRLIQRWLDPMWPPLGGCVLNREIDALISGAGFQIDSLNCYRFGRPAALATIYRGRARPA